MRSPDDETELGRSGVDRAEESFPNPVSEPAKDPGLLTSGVFSGDGFRERFAQGCTIDEHAEQVVLRLAQLETQDRVVAAVDDDPARPFDGLRTRPVTVESHEVGDDNVIELE